MEDYAKMRGTTVPRCAQTTEIERIEDERDLKAWEKAREEFDDDPVVYSADEIAAKYL